MEYEPKYTGENNEEELTFQVEEGILDDLKDSTLTIDQAQEVAYMLEDNAHVVKSGRGTFTYGGCIVVQGEQDAFFQVRYTKPKGGIPTYYTYEDIDSDGYLDHILDESILIQFKDEED